jgi:hypothetical protein
LEESMGAIRTYRVGVLVLMVGMVTAACGSGSSAEVSSFCGDYVEVRGLMGSGPDDADPMPWVEQLTEGLESLQANAPSEISSAVTGISDAVLEPVANLDVDAYFAATESAEFQEDSAVVSDFVGTECGFENVDITAIDYAFDADLDGIEAGTVAFDFSNEGTELHEMALIRINDDVTESVDELLALPEEEAQSKTTFMGVSFAEPGGGDTMYADLDAGRYAVICFIPTGSTSMEDAETADGPPHFTQGMVREFTVEG